MTIFVILTAEAAPPCEQPRPSHHRDCSADYEAMGATIGEGPRGLRLMEVPDEHAKAAADLLEIDRDAFAYVRLGLDVADMKAAEHYLLGARKGAR